MVTVGIANSATHAYSDSGIVMFRNQNIKPNFLDDNDIIHINPEFEARYKNKRLKKNDLLVARTGYPGTACVVPEKYENSQTFTTLIARPKNSVNPYFLCQYLNSDIGVKYFESTQIGGGQKNSGAGILNEMPIMLPSVVEEESKIADYFNHLDNLITLHQRKPISHLNHPTIHTKHKGEEKYVRIRVNDREKTNRTANLRRFPVDIPRRFKDGGGSVGEFQIYSGAE